MRIVDGVLSNYVCTQNTIDTKFVTRKKEIDTYVVLLCNLQNKKLKKNTLPTNVKSRSSTPHAQQQQQQQQHCAKFVMLLNLKVKA
jgi:hypothetical protein